MVASIFIIIYYIRSGSNHQKMTSGFNPPSTAAQKCQDSLYLQGLQDSPSLINPISTEQPLEIKHGVLENHEKTSKKPPRNLHLAQGFPIMYHPCLMTPKWVVMGTPGIPIRCQGSESRKDVARRTASASPK